jgi:hypothetical protein
MAGALTISTLNNDTGVLATQNGMTGIPKAWVNFNGQGTVAIRDSFNVSSITDNGTGEYTVNFTTAMPNANYAYNVNASMNYNAALITTSLNTQGGGASELAPSTTSFRLYIAQTNTTAFDPKYVNVIVCSS